MKERIVAYTTNAASPKVVSSGGSHHRSVRRVRWGSATRDRTDSLPTPSSGAMVRWERSVLVTLITTHALVVGTLPQRRVVRGVGDLDDIGVCAVTSEGQR